MPEPAQVPLNEIPIVPIAEISGKLLDRGELVNLAEYAARRAEKFGQTIASLEAGIAARAADAAKSAQAAGFAPDLQRQAAEKTAAKARAEVTQASDEARWGTLKELNAAAESLALTATLFASPVVVLSPLLMLSTSTLRTSNGPLKLVFCRMSTVSWLRPSTR